MKGFVEWVMKGVGIGVVVEFWGYWVEYGVKEWVVAVFGGV